MPSSLTPPTPPRPPILTGGVHRTPKTKLTKTTLPVGTSGRCRHHHAPPVQHCIARTATTRSHMDAATGNRRAACCMNRHRCTSCSAPLSGSPQRRHADDATAPHARLSTRHHSYTVRRASFPASCLCLCMQFSNQSQMQHRTRALRHATDGARQNMQVECALQPAGVALDRRGGPEHGSTLHIREVPWRRPCA